MPDTATLSYVHHFARFTHENATRLQCKPAITTVVTHCLRTSKGRPVELMTCTPSSRNYRRLPLENGSVRQLGGIMGSPKFRG